MPSARNHLSLPGRPKRVTLQDIAKVAGVHVMTVSDALNDRRSVAPATKERVKQIAQEMNYVPNHAARALLTGRTGVIAILSGAMNEPYYANMVHILERHLTADDFKLLLLRTPREVKDLVNATSNTAVDGAIAVDMHHLVEEFRVRQPVPCVTIGTVEQTFVDHVVADLSSSVEEALCLMLQSGRERIAYLVTAPQYVVGVKNVLAQPSEVRARAYVQAMQNAGQDPEIINVSTEHFPSVRQKFKAYVDQNGCPDALLCQNDDTAMCAYRVIKDVGLTVPDDVLLVGCDGQLHMEYFDPPLATIVQPIEEMSAQAWQFLKRRMAQPDLPLQEATFPGKLVARPSLLPLAAVEHR